MKKYVGLTKFIPVKELKEFENISQDLKEQITHFVHHFDKEGNLLGEAGRNVIKLKQIEGLTINVKSFKIPHFFNQLAYKFLRKSKAKRSFEHAGFLLSKGIGTPKPLAFFEYYSALGLHKSFYVSEHLNCDLTFRDLIKNPDFPDWENILIAATDFTFQLHQNNILFKDHSPGNTLIKKTDKGYQFYLVDLNRMAFKELTFEERIKNFSRLTPKMEMVEIMSKRYAQLINKNPDEVYNLMWKYTSAFQMKFQRKKQLKKMFLLKK